MLVTAFLPANYIDINDNEKKNSSIKNQLSIEIQKHTATAPSF